MIKIWFNINEIGNVTVFKEDTKDNIWYVLDVEGIWKKIKKKPDVELNMY